MPVNRHPFFRDDDPTHDVSLRPDAGLVDRLRADAEVARQQRDRLGVVFQANLVKRCRGVDAPAFSRAVIVMGLDAIVRLLHAPRDVGTELADIARCLSSCDVDADQYPMIIEAIVESLGEVIGQGFDESSAADWRQTLHLVATLMEPRSPRDQP